jgi:hypothetical protein
MACSLSAGFEKLERDLYLVSLFARSHFKYGIKELNPKPSKGDLCSP